LSQENHVIPYQYFRAPFIKKFFLHNPEQSSLFDGLYLDILLSAPYVHEIFDEQRYKNTYCGSVDFLAKVTNYTSSDIDKFFENIFHKNLEHFHPKDDGLVKSQKTPI